jgi:ABC-2 type transport system permease protein
MNFKRNLTAYRTIVHKEVMRMFRVWTQTLLPPVVTMTLYFVVFGKFIGSQIANIDGFSYMQFIVPGLVMMSVVMNAFMHTVSSFYFAKFQKTIEEILVSPTPYWVVIAGYVTGGVVRSLLTGSLVLGVALFFTRIHFAHWGAIFVFALLAAILFSLFGLINAVFAKSFDGVFIIPNFVLTPLTYLGGVFYSVKLLPEFWQSVSLWNPMVYIIGGFRYGILGVSDTNVLLSFGILAAFVVGTFGFVWWLFKTGKGLRT